MLTLPVQAATCSTVWPLRLVDATMGPASGPASRNSWCTNGPWLPTTAACRGVQPSLYIAGNCRQGHSE